MDEWVAIKEMARRGVSISEIARRTGRDRNTIRKVLSETAPREHRRCVRQLGVAQFDHRERPTLVGVPV